jgi:hypothetical protein
LLVCAHAFRTLGIGEVPMRSQTAQSADVVPSGPLALVRRKFGAKGAAMADEPTGLGGMDDDSALADAGGVGGDAGGMSAEPIPAAPAGGAPTRRAAPKRKASKPAAKKKAKGKARSAAKKTAGKKKASKGKAKKAGKAKGKAKKGAKKTARKRR